MSRLFLASAIVFSILANACFAASAAEEKPVLSDRVRLIIGETDEKGYVPRIREVHNLGDRLSEEDIAALLGYLRRDVKSEPLKPLETNAIKNDIVVALMSRSAVPAELPRALIEMFYDKNMDPTWRNYCLQFVGQLYGRMPASDEKDAARKLFWDALEEKDGGMRGTGLICLSAVADEPGMDKARISAAALKIASDAAASNCDRVTALQVCAELGDRNVLPLARQIVASTGDATLRVSAIAALGTLRDAESLSVIQKLSRSGDIRLRAAAKSALKKLESPAPKK